MDTNLKSSEQSQPNPFTKYVQANLPTKHSSHSQSSRPANNEFQRFDSIDFDPIPSNNKAGDNVPKKKEQQPTSPRYSSTVSQTASAPSERNTESSKDDWDDVRKQYEACENPERKVELKQRYKEDILKRLAQLSKVAGSSKVAEEIATIVDFLEILYPESPAINNFHEISKESRDAAMKLHDGLKHLSEAQHLLRQALASSTVQKSPFQQ